MNDAGRPPLVGDERLALATDLYELTMAAGYFRAGRNEEAAFELFVRNLPPRRSYLVVAGLAQAVHYLLNLRFTPAAVDYLRSQPAFRHAGDAFFDYLRDFSFSGDLDAMPEGTVAFENEPLLRVTAPIIEAQVVETYLLAAVSYPTLVATKASRVVDAARGRAVVDFGSRRAHGPGAGPIAARAAYIGGCVGTSNVLAGYEFGIPIFGTMAHSWVMSFESEDAAFRSYLEAFPDNTVLLLDTYDTLRAARRAAKLGPGVRGVRLDSGDLASLSRGVRRILHAAGLAGTRILASGDLNEWRIAELVRQGAPIDAFGVGTDLVTSRDSPALPAVYKLVEQRLGGRSIPRLKESSGKETYPACKQVFRVADARGRWAHDIIGLAGEALPGEPLLVPVVRQGKLAGPLPSLAESRERAAESLARLPRRFRRLRGPQAYPVAWSPGLRKLRAETLRALERKLLEGDAR